MGEDTLFLTMIYQPHGFPAIKKKVSHEFDAKLYFIRWPMHYTSYIFFLVGPPCVKRKDLAITEKAAPPKCGAPSEEAKRKTGISRYDIVPVYYHHIAVLIQDKFKEDEAVSDCILEEFMKGVDKTLLGETKRLLSQLQAIHQRSNEYMCTSLLQRALDRFFFPDDLRSKAALFGQYPVFDTRRSDGSIYTLEENSRDILHYVFKPNKFQEAFDESICYFISAHQNTHKYALTFGLPCTSTDMRFMLYMSGNSRAYCIELDRVQISNMDKLDRFLCIVYASVHYLIKNPVALRESPFACEPIKGVELRDNFEGYDSNRVFLKDGVVYKIYEEGNAKNHNEELLKELNYFQDVKLQPIGRNHFLLSYVMLVGNTKPQFTKDIISALERIEYLHGKKLVHGDIREGNILFSHGTAFLIDFDFTGAENTTYSEFYNGKDKIDERHSGACANQPKKYVHDYHALRNIAERHNVAGDIFRSDNDQCYCGSCSK